MSDSLQPLPIGVDDFKKLREKNYYFIDKSLMIKDIIDIDAEVFLLLRPRRFGKTLHLSMLRYFFDVNEKNTGLFDHLAIKGAGSKYLKYQQKHPVISLTLKNIKTDRWLNAYQKMTTLMASLYNEHRYLLDGEVLHPEEKQIFKDILARAADSTILEKSLKYLSEYLCRHYGQKVVILIDEYDTPIIEASQNDYSKKMLDFMRNFLGDALKGNLALEQAVVTGILRIAKESLFSGVNNLATYSVLDNAFNAYFGWTEKEVNQALSTYGLLDRHEKAAHWYDGYTAGNAQHLYNPWSVMNFISNGGTFRPYWVNTGNSAFLQKLLAQSDTSVKIDLEKLLNDETLNHSIDDSLTLLDFTDHQSLWTHLLLAGYLTALPKTSPDEENIWPLRIPNTEVKLALNKMVKNWFSVKTAGTFLQELLQALTNGDLHTFRTMIVEYIEEILSYFDVKGNEPERFYHAFILGMLVTLKDTHEILSNRESGFGRYDVMLIPHDKEKLGIIIEFKKILKASNDTFSTAIEQAFKQIIDKNYKQQLKDAGIQKNLAVAMVFSGKKITVEGRYL